MYGGGLDSGPRRKCFDIRENLKGQLARRSQDEGPRCSSLSVHHLVKDGEEECSGLSAAGGRAGEKVSAFQGPRNGLGLDGSGAYEAQFTDSSNEGRVQI